MRVVIVGGGVAGLTAAYRLGRHHGVETILLEGDEKPGGRVRTRTLPEGFYADDSAQFVCANYRRALQLIREIGVADELEEIRPDQFAAIYRDGQIHPIPATVTGLLGTATFTPAQRLALVRFAVTCFLRYRRSAYVEPSLLRSHDHVRLSEFVTRKFGTPVLDELVDPFVSMTTSPAVELSLAGVISQVLMPRADKPGLVAAFEVMTMTPGIENHIRKNETFKIPSAIQTGKGKGMFLLDEHLIELYQAGTIDQTQLLIKCQDPRRTREKLGL